jgi:hypothetical protein
MYVLASFAEPSEYVFNGFPRQGSGKTLLVRRMKQICNKRVPEEILDTQPTMGVELDQLPYGGVTLVFREVGGSFVQVRFQPMRTCLLQEPHSKCHSTECLMQVWSNFFEDCGAWAFVVDASNAVSCSQAAIEFWDVLNHPSMRPKRVLLILNKTDAAVAMPMEEIREILRIDDLQRVLGAQLAVLCTGAAAPTGVEEVLKHFAQVCKEPVRSL